MSLCILSNRFVRSEDSSSIASTVCLTEFFISETGIQSISCLRASTSEDYKQPTPILLAVIHCLCSFHSHFNECLAIHIYHPRALRSQIHFFIRLLANTQEHPEIKNKIWMLRPPHKPR